MSEIKAVLFDADGVLTLPEEMFTVLYARSHGLDPQPFEDFFKTDWAEIVTGKKDLKESIQENPDLWQWDGTPEELLDYWFKSEDVKNDSLIKVIRSVRTNGTPCYLATEQETYRGEYMKNIMFKDVFDGHYITAEIGIKKSKPEFFTAIINDLVGKIPNLQPENIVFFDDSQSKVNAALDAGINAHLYTSVDQVEKVLS